MDAVRGLLMDESFLVTEDGSGNVRFIPGAELLLRRLQHSKLFVAISYVDSVSFSRVAFVKNVATEYSFDLIMFNISGLDEALNKILLSWGGVEGRYFYLTFRKDEDIFLKLRNPTWTIIIRASEDGVKTSTQHQIISSVEELPLMLSRFNKSLLNDGSILTVGYVMKSSREHDFVKRGAFPMYPTPNGLMFIPLSFDVSLVSQIRQVDIVLHKATDEIIDIDPHKFFYCSQGITFSKGMQELRRCIDDHPAFCMIDPIDNIYPLLDRLRIQQILLGLDNINMENRCKIRAPHFLQVDTFDKPDLVEKLEEAKLAFPYIVKPQVACGVTYAHDMAIVFQMDDFKDLNVPLPAIVQEYVDHGSFIYKFYVLGEKVFYAIRQSTPNANMLLLSSRENGSKPIIFDSLKSLPKAQGHQNCENRISSDSINEVLDVELVTNAAQWLRRTLNLTILGFDVVIQEGSGDHVVVDVNYLPSFKEIPNEVAVPAFWDALKSAYKTAKSKLDLMIQYYPPVLDHSVQQTDLVEVMVELHGLEIFKQAFNSALEVEGDANINPRLVQVISSPRQFYLVFWKIINIFPNLMHS
ncbi:hypothetical protein H6P81_003467 [Aristolochia fimbriata]|uniref:inositol-1,3,4-trisphosphate 5/6-kinase n=1 Tax=Aristolochia fimbriata TaxID=158543 RepID=A0AAV7FEE6_ARIFI|nr:hypothetical protein H6P81_003467 [Aristolochia fimbriata]